MVSRNPLLGISTLVSRESLTFFWYFSGRIDVDSFLLWVSDAQTCPQMGPGAPPPSKRSASRWGCLAHYHGTCGSDEVAAAPVGKTRSRERFGEGGVTRVFRGSGGDPQKKPPTQKGIPPPRWGSSLAFWRAFCRESGIPETPLDVLLGVGDPPK